MGIFKLLNKIAATQSYFYFCNNYSHNIIFNCLVKFKKKTIHTSRVHPFYWNHLDNSGLFAYGAACLDIGCSTPFDYGLSVTYIEQTHTQVHDNYKYVRTVDDIQKSDRLTWRKGPCHPCCGSLLIDRTQSIECITAMTAV